MNRHNIALKDIDDRDFRPMEFRAREQDSLDDIYNKLNVLFQNAKGKWPGVFPADSVLEMQRATVKSCVKELQNVKLFNSNLEVVDDAFEHLVNQNQKEGMGQYFTPRYVIDMCGNSLTLKTTICSLQEVAHRMRLSMFKTMYLELISVKNLFV